MEKNFFKKFFTTLSFFTFHFFEAKPKSRFIGTLFAFLFVTLSLTKCDAQNSLNSYIQSAIKFSPVFADNENQQQSLALDSLLIRAGLKPQVGFTSNDLYAPVVNGFGYDNAITNGANVNALLGVNYSFAGKKNLSNQFGALNIQKEILQLNKKLTERDLKQSVEQQFITVYGEQQDLKNQQQLLSLLKSEEEILKQLTQSAVYNQTDYLNFLVTYNQSKLGYAQQLLKAKSDLYVLNYLCGIADTSFVSLAAPGVSLTEKKSSSSSLGFQQFVFDSLKLKNDLDKIQFAYKPKLSVLGDAGYNSSFANHPAKNFGASVGLNFSVPIYDGKQRNIQSQKLQLQQSTNNASRNYFTSQFEIRQSQLRNEISQTEKLKSDAQQQLQLSQTLLDADKKLLETGDLHIADYLLALSAYITAQSTVTQLEVSRLQLISQYNYFIQ